MSFYATMSGHVKFANSIAFYATLARLTVGGWANETQFLGEDGDPIDDGQHIFEESGEIRIPQGRHRNLTRVDFFEDPDTTGWIRGSSTDGVEICWVDGPPEVIVPELPLRLFCDPDLEPGDEGLDDDYIPEYMVWMDSGVEMFHGTSTDHIERVARAHCGHHDLINAGVDMLSYARMLETVKKLCARQPPSAEADLFDHILVHLATADARKPTDPVSGQTAVTTS